MGTGYGAGGVSTARGPAPTPDPHPVYRVTARGPILHTLSTPSRGLQGPRSITATRQNTGQAPQPSLHLPHPPQGWCWPGSEAEKEPLPGSSLRTPKGRCSPWGPRKREAVLRPLGHPWPAPSPPRIPLHHSHPLPDCGTPLHPSLSPTQPLPETQLPHQPAFPRALTQVVAPLTARWAPSLSPPPASPRSQLRAGHATSIP